MRGSRRATSARSSRVPSVEALSTTRISRFGHSVRASRLSRQSRLKSDPVPGHDDDRELRKGRGDRRFVGRPAHDRPRALGPQTFGQRVPGRVSTTDRRRSETEVPAQKVERVEGLARGGARAPERDGEQSGRGFPHRVRRPLAAKLSIDGEDPVPASAERAAAAGERIRCRNQHDVAPVLDRGSGRLGRRGTRRSGPTQSERRARQRAPQPLPRRPRHPRREPGAPRQ